MILHVVTYETKSDRPQRHGRDDSAWLDAEGEPEHENKLELHAKMGGQIKLLGASAIRRDLAGLRRIGKHIDPRLKEERIVHRDGKAWIR